MEPAAVERLGRGVGILPIPTEDELIDYVKGKVARFKAPSSVEFRDVLARTATGKLQKFKLRAPFWEGQTRQVN